MRIIKRILKGIRNIVLIIVGILLAASIYFITTNYLSKSSVNDYAESIGKDYYTGINGVIYIPAEDYNAWQMYKNFDPDIIDRDMGYAESVGINAIRVFTSYEYWLDDPSGFMDRFEQFIEIAGKHGISLLPILFEDCGVDNTPESRMADTFETGFCVKSPCLAIQQNKKRYNEVDGYVNSFMEKYGSDERLLAIEIMNEPRILGKNLGFAKYVLKMCRTYDGSVPLTMGQLTIFHNLLFAGELDLYQFHDNFPNSEFRMEVQIKMARFFENLTKRPCWLTEWQRVRKSGGGWDDEVIPEEDISPDLSSLAEVIKENDTCSFFWSLMIKPAYLPAQRPNGTFNGLFYPDGSVYSQKDYQAILELNRK